MGPSQDGAVVEAVAHHGDRLTLGLQNPKARQFVRRRTIALRRFQTQERSYGVDRRAGITGHQAHIDLHGFEGLDGRWRIGAHILDQMKACQPTVCVAEKDLRPPARGLPRPRLDVTKKGGAQAHRLRHALQKHLTLQAFSG